MINISELVEMAIKEMPDLAYERREWVSIPPEYSDLIDELAEALHAPGIKGRLKVRELACCISIMFELLPLCEDVE